MNKKQEKALRDLCIDVHAHCDIDSEITLKGNGTNPGEALNVIRVIEDIMGFEISIDEVNPVVSELKKIYNME